MQGVLQRIWRGWKKVGQAIGDFIARLVLSLFYFTIFVPFALAVRFLKDPLGVKTHANPGWWLERKTRDLTIEDARRQS